MKLSFFYVQLLWVFLQIPASTIYILTFGKGDNCAGFNICNISEEINNEKDENQAKVCIHQKDGRVEFEFIKKTISDMAFLKYFSTGFFVIDTNYQLPPFLMNELSLKAKILKTGKYKINVTSDSYIVTF